MTLQSTPTRLRVSFFLTFAALGIAPVLGAQEAPEAEAQRILAETGVRGGLVVELGCGDGKLSAALGREDGYLVHGLEADPARAGEARDHVRRLGRYGKVSIEHWTHDYLPHADNVVNLLVCENPDKVSSNEILRVLAPGGVALVKQDDRWVKRVKPRPEQLDDWTHSLYDAGGNAVGRDYAVGPPRRIQWVGQPRRARQHEHLASVSVVVSSGGRVFSIEDRGSIASALLPARWLLVARDAFSGVELWTRPVGPWVNHLRAFRMGPPDLSRRLVAVDDRVFVTLGYGKPLVALDAATGQPGRSYEQTEATSEILYRDGILYLVVGSAEQQQAAAGRRGPTPAAPNNPRLLAIEAETGKPRWSKSGADTEGLIPTTLAVGGGRVFFQNDREIHCLDAATGEKQWATARPVTTKRPPWSVPTLVYYEEADVLFSADRAAPGALEKEPGRKHHSSWIDSSVGGLIAFSADSGERLWSCECREGFHAAVDVLVADGLVWTGEVAHADDPGITVGRDPKTGAVKRRRPNDQEFFNVGMPHHRCHRNRATERYLILGRAGVELIDLATGQAIAHHWIRGTCQFGTIPCNGLLYVPPHSCACYLEAKLNGFYALSPGGEKGEEGEEKREESRLERGPAYLPSPFGRGAGGEGGSRVDVANASAPQRSTLDRQPSDWPTYRHDAARSGCTTAEVPAELHPVWQAELGGRLSPLTIASGKVFVADVDGHRVCALDEQSGKLLWHYTAGGRVDSPPTIHEGLCLFGSADGYVYCLRADDGELVWRFRAAPAERRVVAYGQLESAWPVHGSVLVDQRVACFAAGRSSYLDGGIRLVRLEAATGKLLSETRLDSRSPETGHQPKGVIEQFDMPGSLPDVLSCDGTSIYMRQQAFDRQGKPLAQSARHLYSPTGLLDDTWWHRSYWIFGNRYYTGYRDWFRAGREVPAGRILVFDDDAVYGFARKAEYYYWSTALEYHLFGSDRQPEVVASQKKRPRVPDWGQREIRYRWTEEMPGHIRAMVLAQEILFVAGPPDLLRAIATADGRTLAEQPLDAAPVFDGMAATGGRLYLATTNGQVICLAGKSPTR